MEGTTAKHFAGPRALSGIFQGRRMSLPIRSWRNWKEARSERIEQAENRRDRGTGGSDRLCRRSDHKRTALRDRRAVTRRDCGVRRRQEAPNRVKKCGRRGGNCCAGKSRGTKARTAAGFCVLV